MKLSLIIARYLERLDRKTEDPIEASKKMIASIEQLVGIHNLFGDKKRNWSFLSPIGIILLFLPFFYVGPFSQVIYLVKSIPNKTEVFKALDCISATSVPFSKYLFMWFSRDRFKHIFTICREGMGILPKDSPAEKAYHQILSQARYMAWLVIFNIAVPHILYVVVPMVLTLISNESYLPTTPGESFGLTPQYESPNYELTFFVTTLGTVFSAVNQTGYIILFITLLAHELGHFSAITATLNDLYQHLSDGAESQIERKKRVREALKFCVKDHQFLLRYHAVLQSLYRGIFGAHYAMMIVVLVTTMQTYFAWDLRNTILTFVTGIVPLSIYCFGGELLLTYGVDMSTSIYSCGWEFMDPIQAKQVLLMLFISQHPLHLTAADVFIMNRETFGDVVQVIYKVYTVFK